MRAVWYCKQALCSECVYVARVAKFRVIHRHILAEPAHTAWTATDTWRLPPASLAYISDSAKSQTLSHFLCTTCHSFRPQVGEGTKIAVPDRPDAAEPPAPKPAAPAPAAAAPRAAPAADAQAAAAAAEAKRRAAVEEAKAKLQAEQVGVMCYVTLSCYKLLFQVM
jgi:hypothetical protein